MLSLSLAGKSTVWRILDEKEIKPHKIRYYLEKRDPDFDRKMQEVLMVYGEVFLEAAGAVDAGRPDPLYTVSVDEKPGFRRSASAPPTCRHVRARLSPSGATTNTSATAPSPSWPASTCTRATSSHAWKTAIAAWSSSGC